MRCSKSTAVLTATILSGLLGLAAAPVALAKAPPLPVTIVLHDHGFAFRNIGIRATRIRLDVKNGGHHRHALAIKGLGHGDDLEIVTHTLAPGASTVLTLRLPPGRYSIFSPVDHDRSHGLTARMRFTEPSPAGSDGAEMDRVFYDY